jgi:hypothetical protein
VVNSIEGEVAALRRIAAYDSMPAQSTKTRRGYFFWYKGSLFFHCSECNQKIQVEEGAYEGAYLAKHFNTPTEMCLSGGKILHLPEGILRYASVCERLCGRIVNADRGARAHYVFSYQPFNTQVSLCLAIK